MTKGKLIDLTTADDSTVVDSFDLMETLGVSRETIRVRIRKGILPPALDRAGKRLRWTVGYLRDWDRLRASQAINALSKQKHVTMMKGATTSEFG